MHLKACTWTRDGSLTSEIISCLAGCPELTDITLNGGYSPHYEPIDLVQLLRPRKVSLIMPCVSVVRILPHWLRAIGQSLTSLSLICKACIFSVWMPLTVSFIHVIGRRLICYRQLPREYLTMSFATRASQFGWVSKSDERGCLVYYKT